MVATTPRGELASKRSVARSPYCAASRARMLARPTPEPEAAANPCPYRRPRAPAFAFAGSGEADRAAFGERPDAMLDRVLDEGREHHRRNASLEQRRRRVDRALQPRAHADLLHAHESRNELDLVGERNVVSRILAARRADTGQAGRAWRALRGIALTEAPHVRESVEQEMRLDLRLQQAQLRLELLLLERRSLQLGGVDLLTHRAGCADRRRSPQPAPPPE